MADDLVERLGDIIAGPIRTDWWQTAVDARDELLRLRAALDNAHKTFAAESDSTAEILAGYRAALATAEKERDRALTACKALDESAPIDSEWGTCGCCNRKRGHEDDCAVVLARTAIRALPGKESK